MHTATWTLFVAAIVFFFIQRARLISLHFSKAKSLKCVGKQILKDLGEKGVDSLDDLDAQDSVIVMDHNGTTLFADTKNNVKNKKGQDLLDDHINIYKQMKNEDSITTTFVINEDTRVISAIKVQNEDFFVIVYII